jgi:hypothetical protein
MSSSANTFGTFLQTFGNLEKQTTAVGANTVATTGLDEVVGLVQDIAKNGDGLSFADIVAHSPMVKEQVLAALLKGREQGLIDFSQSNGETIANLTNLGKSFSF